MKKKIFCIMTIIIFCIMINFCVKAATVDNNPPELKKISLKQNEAVAGERVYLDMEAIDDVSGIESGTIGIYSVKKEYIPYQLEIKDINKNPYFILDNYTIEGEYTLAFVLLRDNSGNIQSYYNSLYYDENNIVDIFMDFEDYNLTVISNMNDIHPPVLTNVSLNADKIMIGEAVKLTISATDSSEITMVTADMYRTGYGFDNSINISFKYDDISDSYIRIFSTRTNRRVLYWLYTNR